MTPFFKLSPFLFFSQRNANLLKSKLRLSFGDLQVTWFESPLPTAAKAQSHIGKVLRMSTEAELILLSMKDT